MKKIIFTLLFTSLLHGNLSAQKDIRTFIFGHSLIHHEYQLNPTPSQETSIPHWFHFLSQAAGHSYAVAGQYGFLPQHAQLPPISNWYFEVADNIWDSDNESFAAANFNNILITPGNFIQWQGPSENYPSENISPIVATQQVFDWCLDQNENLNFYIYENWPDMAGFLSNGFPPTASEWNDYNEYINGDFQDWFLEYYRSIKNNFPNACIGYIPVGTILSKLLQTAPLNEIPIDALYEDDAPHGRASIYFLASLVTYMAMYEEEAPANYVPNEFIHPIISGNYNFISSFIWTALNEFHNLSDKHNVYCDSFLTTNDNISQNKPVIQVYPNPVIDQLTIELDINKLEIKIEIYDKMGTVLLQTNLLEEKYNSIDLDQLPAGIYYMIVKRESTNFYSQKIIKI